MAAVKAPALQAAAAPVDESRLAQLEAKLAQVTAALAKGVAAPAAAPASRPAPRPAPPRPAAAAGEAVGALTADNAGLELWQGLIQTLRSQNKAPTVACLQQGRFVGMNQSQFVIAFANTLMADLTARNYRKACEEILANLAGRPLRLVVRGEDRPIAPPPQPQNKPQPAVQEEEPARVEIPPEERTPALNKAIEVFGDNIVAVKEENS
jgi:DNA polymerase-3 subunit gamma/tau